ncbi:MAG: uracil-DNA glycosylase [Myxococcales bacterium]|nr:uracil-DNA glycosylase [Myxococcales bacterium]
MFGVGNPEADLMFVGEAPGADEDRQGVPFVGRAGQRLTAFLDELSLPREQVYIANVLKCRPPGNRDPQPNEVAECSRFLEAQIRAIQPRVLIALGRHAASLLLRRQNLTLRNLRGRTWKYEQAKGSVAIPLIVTYHPSFVLRREGDDARRGVKRHGPSEVHEAVMTDLREALRISRASPR